MPEARIRSVRELRCGVWEVDIIDASRKRLRRRFRAESADGARAAALAMKKDLSETIGRMGK